MMTQIEWLRLLHAFVEPVHLTTKSNDIAVSQKEKAATRGFL